MPPAYVKPYVKRGKTDACDAEAICEAVCRPTMRFVPVKTAAQQSEAMVLKIWNLIVRQRNQTINALRAYLSEFGIVAGVGIGRVADQIAVVRDTDDIRSPGEARAVLAGLAEQFDSLSTRLRQSGGPGGPLRGGLPWQSGHDGKALVHEPLRLTVIVEAPREAVASILQRNPEVGALFDNGWLALYVMSENGTVSHRYDGNGLWTDAGAGSFRTSIMAA